MKSESVALEWSLLLGLKLSPYILGYMRSGLQGFFEVKALAVIGTALRLTIGDVNNEPIRIISMHGLGVWPSDSDLDCIHCLTHNLRCGNVQDIIRWNLLRAWNAL